MALFNAEIEGYLFLRNITQDVFRKGKIPTFQDQLYGWISVPNDMKCFFLNGDLLAELFYVKHD